jgi:hypothetical protein
MKKILLSLLAVALVSSLTVSSLRAEGGCSGCKGDKKEETKKEEPKKS